MSQYIYDKTDMLFFFIIGMMLSFVISFLIIASSSTYNPIVENAILCAQSGHNPDFKKDVCIVTTDLNQKFSCEYVKQGGVIGLGDCEEIERFTLLDGGGT